MGDYQDIQKGYSKRFDTEINVDYFDAYDDEGLNPEKAKLCMSQ